MSVCCVWAFRFGRALFSDVSYSMCTTEQVKWILTKRQGFLKGKGTEGKGGHISFNRRIFLGINDQPLRICNPVTRINVLLLTYISENHRYVLLSYLNFLFVKF